MKKKISFLEAILQPVSSSSCLSLLQSKILLKILTFRIALLVSSSSPFLLRPSSPLSRLCPRSPPSRLCPSSRLHPPSLPSPLSPLSQLHLPPSPQPCTPPPMSLEARSPPGPPDLHDAPFDLVHLLRLDTSCSQQFSETPNLKSHWLNLELVFSDDVVSLVYVGDTSCVSKCLSPAVCNVFLCWCDDWIPHCFFPGKFIYPPLPFIILGIVLVDSTMGCSVSITISEAVTQSCDLYLPLALVRDLYLPLALVRPFTAVCSSFTALCSFTFVVIKSFYAQLWQLKGLMPHISIHHVNWVLLNVYFPVSSIMEFVLLPISLSTLCGVGAGSILLKIRDTSNTEVLIKGFVAMLKIVDCALVAASISGFISLIVVLNFQGFISFYSSMVAEIRGLLDVISCLSVLYATILLCCICFSFSVYALSIHGK